MPYYDEQTRQGYNRSTSPLSQAPTYLNSEPGRYRDEPSNRSRNPHRPRPDPRSYRSQSSSSASSRSSSPPRSTRSAPRYKKPDRRDTLAKAGIIIGAIAVFAGVKHMMDKHRAEQQVAYQRERRVETARRERRRKKEEEEDRRAEEEERRRDEYDNWTERGRRGMYIEGPQEERAVEKDREGRRAR